MKNKKKKYSFFDRCVFTDRELEQFIYEKIDQAYELGKKDKKK